MTDRENLAAICKDVVLAAFDSTADCDVGLSELRDAMEEIDWQKVFTEALRTPQAGDELAREQYAALRRIAVEHLREIARSVGQALASIDRTAVHARDEQRKHQRRGHRRARPAQRARVEAEAPGGGTRQSSDQQGQGNSWQPNTNPPNNYDDLDDDIPF